jgi:hypothetical protein
MFFNIFTTYDGQMKGGKIPSVATFKTCFDDHVNMKTVVVGSNNGNPKTSPPALHGNAQYCYIHGTQIFKQIDQCKKNTKIGKT